MKRKELARTVALVIFSAALISTVLAANLRQKRDNSRRDVADQVRNILQKQLDDMRQMDGFPGGTAAAVLPDGRLISVSTGYSDLESRTPMKPSDRMLAGSIGKTFFSTAILRIIKQNHIDLDEKIEKWIGDEPWFPKLPNAHEITLRMLFNHTSGIPEHVESPEFVSAIWDNVDKVWTPVELLSFIFGKPALFPAGTGWSYADTNFILLSFVAEKISGRKLYDLIQQTILNPLHLDDTIPSTSRTLPGLIAGYSMPNSPFKLTGSTMREHRLLFNPQFEWAGGGFVSTSSDLARWAKALYEGKLLEPDLLALMLQSVPARTGRGDRYGLGVQIRYTDFGETEGHGGWFPGYLSEVEYFPKYHIAFAVQVNTDHFDRPGGKTHSYIVSFARAILPEFQQTEGSPTAPKSIPSSNKRYFALNYSR